VLAYRLAFSLKRVVREVPYYFLWQGSEVVVQAGFFMRCQLALLNRPASPPPRRGIDDCQPHRPDKSRDARYAPITKGKPLRSATVFGGDKWIWLIPISITLLIAVVTDILQIAPVPSRGGCDG